MAEGNGGAEANPLLENGPLPAFDRVEAEHVEPAVRKLLAELESELSRIEESAAPSYLQVIAPLESLNDRLGAVWGAVGHLMGVRNSDALREAYEAVQGEVVAFGLRQGQSRPIYDALVALEASDEYAQLDAAQRRIVDELIRGARHAGVALEGAEKERFNEIQQALAQLSTEFSNHVLDATKAFSITVRESNQMAGTPESLRELTAQAAREAGEADADAVNGPWRLTLDAPCLIPFLEHARTGACASSSIARTSPGRAQGTSTTRP